MSSACSALSWGPEPQREARAAEGAECRLRRLLLGTWLPQNYDMTIGQTRVADLRQNFNLFRYELNLDFSMDISHLLDRRVGIAAGILLAAVEGKQSS